MTDETRQEIARQLAIELASRTVIPPRRSGQGFKTFSEFKRTVGAAGTGQAFEEQQDFGMRVIKAFGGIV